MKLDLSVLFPQKVEEFNSNFNGKITVEKFRRKYSVKVGGLSQSGGLVESLWKEALKEISIIPKNILILGFGSGTLANILSKKFPDTKIIGIEIDKYMTDIGKRYLGINDIKNLVIKITDAEDFIKENKEKFDLIFVDIYQGEYFPKKFETKEFLKKIKEKISTNGMIVFNRLYYTNHISEANNFLDKISKIFNDSNCKNIKYNLLVFAKN